MSTVETLRQGEPYRSRFVELSTGLVDALGTILGAIATGLERGLAPAAVFAVAEVQRVIDEHVRVRQSVGLGLAAVIREDQLLTDQADQFLQGLVGLAGFTIEDAVEVSRQLQAFAAALVRILVARYRPDHEPPPGG